MRVGEDRGLIGLIRSMNPRVVLAAESIPRLVKEGSRHFKEGMIRGMGFVPRPIAEAVTDVAVPESPLDMALAMVPASRIKNVEGVINTIAKDLYSKIDPLAKRFIGLEDLIQEGRMAYLQASKAFDPAKATSGLEEYGTAVARNRMVDFLRRQHAMNRKTVVEEGRARMVPFPDRWDENDVLSNIPSTGGLPIDEVLEFERVKLLNDALDSLSPKERAVMRMLLEGAKSKDVADRYGLSEPSISVIKNRALKSMQRYIQDRYK